MPKQFVEKLCISFLEYVSQYLIDKDSNSYLPFLVFKLNDTFNQLTLFALLLKFICICWPCA